MSSPAGGPVADGEGAGRSELIKQRVCAEIETEIVVFLIGMRINKIWKFWKWLPVMRAMSGMLRELAVHPELGLLHARGQLGLRNLWSVQYWKSAAHLQDFARAADKPHLPAWQAFHRKVGTSGDIGIWHETYVVPRGNVESIYLNMPRHGLGLVGPLVPATGPRGSAAQRLGRVSGAASVSCVRPDVHACAAGTSHGDPLHDVTTGRGSEFNAANGYELVTSIDAPQGPACIDELAGT